MFFLKDLSLTLSLHPSFFGPNMRTYLKRKLLSDVEGTCSGQYGYIICVLDNHKIDIGAGKIVPGLGLAEFTVKYQAIIFKPFKGEVVDATVATVNKIFVSIHLIPPDLKFYPDANPPNYSNEEQSILKGAMVRIKIMGLRMDVKDIFAIGTIKEDYLGVL